MCVIANKRFRLCGNVAASVAVAVAAAVDRAGSSGARAKRTTDSNWGMKFPRATPLQHTNNDFNFAFLWHT